MTRFIEIDEQALAGATLFVDVDGTLVADRVRVLDLGTREKLRRLASACRLYLCSNGSPVSAREFAKETGADSLAVFKPLPGKARGAFRPGERAVVIGDKYLTDGIFAGLLGAEFIRVDRVVAPTDGLFARITYLLDGVVWHVAPYIVAVRPWHWVKNLLVFAPLFFAAGIMAPGPLFHASIAFVAFSAAASAVYVMNDLFDLERDRLHPRKRLRPLASGRLSIRGAAFLLAILSALTFVSVLSVSSVLLPVIAYVGLNIAYSAALKHVAVADIACVSTFYLLRIVAGGLAASVPLSPWIMLCAMFGALFVIIGKRRAEAHRETRRKVLEEYSLQALDFMLVASAALAIMAYGIYSVIGHTSGNLVYSTGFVAFALFRMLNRMYTHPEDAESPELLVFRDPWILGAFVGWVIYTFAIFYML